MYSLWKLLMNDFFLRKGVGVFLKLNELLFFLMKCWLMKILLILVFFLRLMKML